MNIERAPAQHPDLEALRRSDPDAARPPRRPWLPRVTLYVLVLGLLGAAYAVLRPVFFPPRVVTLAGVRVADTAPGQRSASFVQAAGWVEADPYPVTVRPLVRGIVETLAVVEGSAVTKDETVIATLRNVDLENALQVAEAEWERQKARTLRAQTTLDVTRSLLAQKLDLRAQIAERQGQLATVRAEVDRARARRKAAEAQLDGARIELKAQADLQAAGQVTPTALATAKARVDGAEQRVTELRFEEVRVVSELGRITALLDLAREALTDPRGLQGAVDEAQAAVTDARAAVDRAQADVAVARSNVAHLTIRAPMTGVVMRLESAPGAVVGPEGAFKGLGEGAGSTGLLNRMTGSLCSLYDPRHLQVRVDVPYDDLPGIEAGTEVEFEARAVPGQRFHGVVSRLVREADITQAKLQVKVRVADPDPRLRPEMLCTARFIVKAGAAVATEGEARTRVQRLLVPTEALRGEAVFVFDPTGGGIARRIAVRVVQRGEAWTEVEGALGLSSKVILDDVQDGESVKGKNHE